MSKTLRVFVGEDWPERPSTRWVLLDSAGAILQQGESDGLRWPVAEYCEAVMSAAQASWLRASLPRRAAKRDLLQILPGVLEDSLLEDPDRCHLTVCGHEGDSVDVLVIARARLRNIVAQFQALEHPLVAAYSELEAVAAPVASGVTIALTRDAAILRRPGAVPLVLDPAVDGQPPTLLATLGPDIAGSQVTVMPEAQGKADILVWREAAGTEQVRIGETHCWHALPAGAANLLHGEFASRQRRNSLWQAVRLPAYVAIAALMASVAVGLIQAGWLYFRIGATESRAEALFRASFPGVPVVAPVAQARRQLDDLRARHGLGRSDDAVVLLAGVSEVLGVSGEDAVQELKYSDRRLLVVLMPSLTDRLEAMRGELESRGYRVTVQSSPNRPALTIELDSTR